MFSIMDIIILFIDPAVYRIYYSCFHIPDIDGFGASFEVGLSPSIENVQCTSNETQLSQCVYDVRSALSWRCIHSVFKISCKTSRESKPLHSLTY